jgi:hypothetical protein
MGEVCPLIENIKPKEKQSMKKYTLFVGVTLLASASIGTVFAEEEKADAVAGTTIVAKEGVPGGTVISTLELEAKVVEIDQEDRTAVLELPNGGQMPIQVGPEAINFDQVKVGDTVQAILTEQLIVAMAAEDSAKDDGASVTAMLAPKGAMPGSIVAETIRMTGTVTIINAEERTATLKFEDGSTKTIAVRPDIDLTQHSVGEKVAFQITQMVALSVQRKE